MSVFKSVLVGIDLLQTDSQDSRSFSPPVEEAIKHGLWLAERASASVTFFAAVDVPGVELHPLEAYESHVVCQLERSGRRALERLVATARKRGLSAHSRLVSGRAWVEIIREVEQSSHDVVVVGSRRVGAVKRFLFGSTVRRLLHNCPCPVWVTRPDPRPFPHNILITSDFSPVSEVTVKLGLAIGELCGGKVHLMHAVDYILDRLWSVGLLHTNTEEYHARLQAEARERLTEQLARVAGGKPTAAVEVHVVAGMSIADKAILEFIDQHQIDLLLLGTMTHGGYPVVSIGNTAVRLVTYVPCAMVGVKPPGFKSPVGSSAAGGE